jgi:hypothetical protein
MVHRRLLKDDGRGVNEALNETEPYNTNIGLKIITSHALLLNETDLTRRHAEDYFNEPLQLFFGYNTANSTNTTLAESNEALGLGTAPSLPANFKAYWRPQVHRNIVLRLQNVASNGPVEFNVSAFVAAHGANVWVAELGLSEN